jgi:deoxyribodipyrimidine photo-lyase
VVNKKAPSKAICWLRRDIRLSDHAALQAACQNHSEVFVVFIFDSIILDKLEDRDDKRLTFIHSSLAEIDEAVQDYGSALVVRHGDPLEKIPALARELGVSAVYANHDYEPYAKRRDMAVTKLLRENGIDFLSFKDQVIFESKQILTGGNTPFKVFTPYKNAWLKQLQNVPEAIGERNAQLKNLSPRAAAFSQPYALKKLGFTAADLWLVPGASGAKKRWTDFQARLADYTDKRNYPDIDGTSGLSVHLRFGTISVRHLVRDLRKLSSKGSMTFLSELIWRDFYEMILDQYPHVAKEPFREQYASIVWPGKEVHFQAWCEGRTGFPIVDAAMRQLNTTGFMHNRLRMVSASFFVKDLLLDYRRGEHYFARKLLDYDLSANNGGWQWSASTGCDSQPYFRVFNPLLQSKRYDADGNFIRKYVPELAGYPARYIHAPNLAPPEIQKSAGCIVGKTYPKPIVEHGPQKERAVDLFRKNNRPARG